MCKSVYNVELTDDQQYLTKYSSTVYSYSTEHITKL